MKAIKRITALSLALAVFGANLSTASAHADYNVNKGRETSHHGRGGKGQLRDITTTVLSNDDAEFPLYLDVDISEKSVRYIKLKEPMYGQNFRLDAEALDFDVILSLKEDYNFFDNYEITVFDSDNIEVFTGAANSTETITLSELSADESYSFSFTLNSDIMSSEFVGELVPIVEIDNSLVLDLFYQNSANRGEIATFVSPNEEYEPNNTQAYADDLQNRVSTLGTFSSTSDVDYFYYQAPTSVPNGIVNLNIALSVPTGTRITMKVYNESGSYNTTKTSSSGTGVNFKLNNLNLGEKYYIKLSRYSGDFTDKDYYLTVHAAFGDAWYSQYVSTYWNSYKLDTLNIKSGSTTKYVFKENGGSSDSWMGTSCGIVAAAMVIRNLGKTMNGYDFRTDFTGELMADPFTVMLANCKIDGTTMNVNTTSLTSINSPNNFTSGNIATKFDITNKIIENGKSGLTSEANLRALIDKYNYVMVYLKGSPNHWMVFTDYNTTGSTFAERFTVYDPAAKSYSKGAKVLLSNTSSGYSSKSFSDIEKVTILY